MPPMADPAPVKLRARDKRDMEVLSAVLQDALVSPADMAFLEREKRFVMVVSRFRWEHPESDVPPAPDPDRDARFQEAGPRTLFERVNAGVCFDRVRRVRTRGLSPRNRDRILNLLAIETERNAITLVFSDGPVIRLEVSAIACHLEDLGEPWATPWRPVHDAPGPDDSAPDGPGPDDPAPDDPAPEAGEAADAGGTETS